MSMEESLGVEQDRAAGPVIHRAKSVEENSTRPPSLKPVAFSVLVY
jgi:hypothetical protein